MARPAWVYAPSAPNTADRGNCNLWESESGLSKVSVVGVGMRSHAGVALKMFEVLGKENIHVHLISTSEIKISCVIDGKYAELAVRALHEGFELGKG